MHYEVDDGDDVDDDGDGDDDDDDEPSNLDVPYWQSHVFSPSNNGHWPVHVFEKQPVHGVLKRIKKDMCLTIQCTYYIYVCVYIYMTYIYIYDTHTYAYI